MAIIISSGAAVQIASSLRKTHFIVYYVIIREVYTCYNTLLSRRRRKKKNKPTSATDRILCTGADAHAFYCAVIVDTSCAHPAAAAFISTHIQHDGYIIRDKSKEIMSGKVPCIGVTDRSHLGMFETSRVHPIFTRRGEYF